MADETPEGRSIVVLAKKCTEFASRNEVHAQASFVPFTAQTRMSGVDLEGREIRKGAPTQSATYVEAKGGMFPSDQFAWQVDR